MNTVGTPTNEKKGLFSWLTPARMIWFFYLLVCAISIRHMSYYFGMEESKDFPGQVLSYAYALCIDIGQGALTWGVISVVQSTRKHKWVIVGFMTFILLGLVAFSYIGNVTYAMGNTDPTLLAKANQFVPFTGDYTYIASLLPILILVFTLVISLINQQDPLANMSAVQIANLRKEQEEARTILIQMEQTKLTNDGLEANLAISRAQLQGSKIQGIFNGLVHGMEKPEEPSSEAKTEEPTRFVAQPVQEYQTIQEVDKLALTLEVLRINPEITDEELAVHLDLKRAASARFWKLKAREILSLEASPMPLAKVTTGPLVQYSFNSTQNEYEIEGRTYWTAKRAANEWEIAESRVSAVLKNSAKRLQLPEGSWLPLKHGESNVYIIESMLAPHYREWIAGRTQLTLVQTGTGGN